jgi:hypothetical protein
MIKKLSLTSFLILCLVVVTVLRSFFFKSFGTFSGDDRLYVEIAKNLFPNLMISVDGITPHTIWPPGYPFILAIQKFIFGSYFATKYMQYVFITAFISLITLAIARFLNLKITYLSIVLCVLNPLFILHPATNQISAGTWYTIITLTGTFSVLKFSSNFKFKYLLLGSSCYAISYLLRPEGLSYFSTVIVALIYWHIKTKPKLNFISLAKPLFSLGIPLIIFILPYIYFLYVNIGELVISGKSTVIDGLVASGNQTPLEHYISNIISIGRIFIAPLLLGPLVLILFLGYVWLALNRKIKTNISDLILLAPIPILLSSFVVFYALGRAMYSSIPIFLILSLKTLDYLQKKFNPSLKTQNLLLISIILYQLVIIFSPVILGRFDNTPKLYYQAVDFITHEMALANNERAIVYSRDRTLNLYNKNLEVCYDLEACTEKFDYLILSNFNHVKLKKKSSHEENKIFKESIVIKSSKCNRARTFSRGAFRTEVYSCG